MYLGPKIEDSCQFYSVVIISSLKGHSKQPALVAEKKEKLDMESLVICILWFLYSV